MTHEQLAPKVRAWLKSTTVGPEDARRSVGIVSGRVDHTRQRGRSWPLPSLGRRTSTHVVRTDMPAPAPATNGYSPTVIGRTQIMFSPAKALIVGALAYALSGAFLNTQPFGQQGSVPGAETEAGVAEPVPFTVHFLWTDENVREAEDVTEGGLTRSIGSCNRMEIADPSDPRMDGELTWCSDEHVYGQIRDASPVVGTDTWRIVSDDGAWQGSHHAFQWNDPSTGQRLFVGETIPTLIGEGAYDGLYAVMTLIEITGGNTWDVRGLIFEGPPPDDPVPPAAG